MNKVLQSQIEVHIDENYGSSICRHTHTLLSQTRPVHAADRRGNFQVLANS